MTSLSTFTFRSIIHYTVFDLKMPKMTYRCWHGKKMSRLVIQATSFGICKCDDDIFIIGFEIPANSCNRPPRTCQSLMFKVTLGNILWSKKRQVIALVDEK